MEDKSLLFLTFLFQKTAYGDYGYLDDLFIRIKDILIQKPKGIDAVLELKLGLHKFFSMLIATESRKNFNPEVLQKLFGSEDYDLFLRGIIYTMDSSLNFKDEQWIKEYFSRWARDKLVKKITVFLILKAIPNLFPTRNTQRVAELWWGIPENMELRKREIITQLYAKEELTPRIYTLEEIGEKLNLTRERVQQIKAKAIRIMKDKEEELWRAFNGSYPPWLANKL